MSEDCRKTRELTEAVRAERGTRIRNRMMAALYPLTATPRLSAAKSVWRYAKYRPATSEHHETPEDLAHAVSEYFGTCPIRFDIYRFVYRCVWGEIFNEHHFGAHRSNWQT